jgi:uncharacterized protein (TIGR02466 family)|tara:strand:+ start:6927 stop:7502 length:576 start_codon:yes stop_codon:yes gene_type:complete
MITYEQHMFGPLLYKTQLNTQDLSKVEKLCSKKNKDARDILAGVIKSEHVIDEKKYAKIVEPYFQPFQKRFHFWYNRQLLKLQCNSAWVNYMKKNESNPPHHHINCDLSSVLYLQIPSALKKENKKYIGKSSGPGSIIFSYGEYRDYNIDQQKFLPNKGDFFIFPYNLKHYVCPFTSNGERISVSANFKII